MNNALATKLKDRLDGALDKFLITKNTEDGWKVFWGELKDGTPIYIVNDEYVCAHYSVGFVDGAHSLARKWMPQRPRQIWVEEKISLGDMAFNLDHEINEYLRMKHLKERYGPAHDWAEDIEGLIRDMANGVKPTPTREDETGTA